MSALLHMICPTRLGWSRIAQESQLLSSTVSQRNNYQTHASNFHSQRTTYAGPTDQHTPLSYGASASNDPSGPVCSTADSVGFQLDLQELSDGIAALDVIVGPDLHGHDNPTLLEPDDSKLFY